MENFRILLDLSDLEDRVHKYVWMLISTIDLKYVADFKKAVINKLALKRNDIKMFINGGLLLEEEKIMILRENDTVQIQYEKLSDPVCRSSSYMEMQDNKFALSIGEYNGNECVKNYKKHNRKCKDVSVEVADENIEKDLSNIEEYNGNKIAKHSKKHKRKSKEVSLEVANDNEEKDLNIRKRKRDVAAVDKLETIEDDILIQVENPMNSRDINVEGICNRKKHKKSFSTPSAKDVNIQNERNKIEEIDTKLAGATTITLDESSQESRKMEENRNSKTNDIAVGSLTQGSNCKKRKRKRHRKRRMEQNLIGPFMSANMNTLQELTKDSPSILEQSDNFAAIRKHIRFTSPTPDSNNKEITIVDLETNCPDSQAEVLPNIAPCITPIAKPLSFPTRRMYIDNANQIANKVYSTMSQSLFPSVSPSLFPQLSPSVNSSCTSPTVKISSLTTSKTYEDHENMLSPKLSSKTGIEPSSSTSLVSTNPIKSEIFTLTKQKSLLQNSQTVSSMPQENGNKSSFKVSVLKGKECEPLQPVTLSCEGYSPLNALPPIGTHIAFKLLELDENYTPVVSKYKEGVIKSIDPKSEELEIELIKVEIKPGRTGKFENLNEDEAPSDEIIRTVTVPWSSLIEPRFISHS